MGKNENDILTSRNEILRYFGLKTTTEIIQENTEPLLFQPQQEVSIMKNEFDKKSTDPRTGVSPNSPPNNSVNSCEPAKSSQTETVASTKVTRVNFLTGKPDRNKLIFVFVQNQKIIISSWSKS